MPPKPSNQRGRGIELIDWGEMSRRSHVPFGCEGRFSEWFFKEGISTLESERGQPPDCEHWTQVHCRSDVVSKRSRQMKRPIIWIPGKPLPLSVADVE